MKMRFVKVTFYPLNFDLEIPSCVRGSRDDVASKLRRFIEDNAMSLSILQERIIMTSSPSPTINPSNPTFPVFAFRLVIWSESSFDAPEAWSCKCIWMSCFQFQVRIGWRGGVMSLRCIRVTIAVVWILVRERVVSVSGMRKESKRFLLDWRW